MPKFTQPIMYEEIGKHPNVLEIYSKKLMAEKVVSEDELKVMLKKVRDSLESAYRKAKDYKPVSHLRPVSPQWADMATADEICGPRLTGVNEDILKGIGREICQLPIDLKTHPTISRVYKARFEAVKSGDGIDFALAESLAFGSLLRDGCKIRLAGQDVERGTFSHRHAVVHDQKTGKTYTPLKEFVKNRKLDNSIDFQNSHLSEFAALGFEYGYSLETPKCLNLWEAQFGDFANGAQVVIDQFITSGETKWNLPTGLVLLLPHGYDGQGPEHSSARYIHIHTHTCSHTFNFCIYLDTHTTHIFTIRIERFLSLCDDREDVIHPECWNVARRSVIQKHNIQVCNVSTASNYFHLLRRQIHRGFRKPLVIFTPKKLLRMRGQPTQCQTPQSVRVSYKQFFLYTPSSEATSPIGEFTDGSRFARYICDPGFKPCPHDEAMNIGKGLGPDRTSPNIKERHMVERLVLCSGQVYYDLIKSRKEMGMDDKVMIARYVNMCVCTLSCGRVCEKKFIYVCMLFMQSGAVEPFSNRARSERADVARQFEICGLGARRTNESRTLELRSQ